MKVFGLTGGIGMGKSAAAEILSRRGLSVVDTDLLARQIVEPGQPALQEIQRAFGDHLVGPDGQLRRGELARIAFANADARQKLESITHPRIRELWRARIKTWAAERRPVAVIVIPLLFETGAESELDATVCIACSPVTQRQRLLERGWTPEEIQQRIASQWPIEKKMNHADHVVWNEAGLDVLEQQLARIFVET